MPSNCRSARKNSAHFFHEFARRHGDYAIVGLAAQAIVEGDRFTDLRLAFFAVGDRPVLARAAHKPDRRRHHARRCCRRHRRHWAKSSIPRKISRRPPAMRRHLAKVLLARCVSALLDRPDLDAGGSCVTAPVANLARGQWRARRCACPAAAQSRGLPARASATDRNACRLRARRVRRLHGARQRRDRSFLPDAGGAGARRDRSRPSRDCPTAARSPICRPHSAIATRCNAALHAGHADGRAGSVETAGRAGPGADPRASFRQLLPLHRLPGHCRCGRDHGARARRVASHDRRPRQIPKFSPSSIGRTPISARRSRGRTSSG